MWVINKINASAINSKTLKVTFNKAAAVKADDFKVNKGLVKVNIAKVEIAEDAKSATIEMSSKLTKGEYTVTIDQGDKDALVSKVTVEDERLANVEFLSDVAVKVADVKKATTTVKVTNQYGEDITKLNTGLSINVSGAGTGGRLKPSGELELDLTNAAKIDDKIIVTLVDTKTGVSATKTLTLSDVATATDVAFGEVYNVDGKTLTQDTDLSKETFYLPITVKDQYGKEILDASKLTGAVVITNTNNTIVEFSAAKKVKINDKEVLALEVTDVGFAGTANIIMVSTTSGKSAQTGVTVGKGVKVDSLSLSTPAELVTAEKDVYFPLTVVDTNGNEVKTLTELNKIKDAVTPSIGTIVDKNAKGDKGLFVHVKHATNPVTAKKALTVTVTTALGKVSTQTVIPEEKAVPTVITGINPKKATALRNLAGEKIEIKGSDLIVEDQYGQVIDFTGIAFDVVSSDTDAIKVTASDSGKTWTLTPEVGTTKTGSKLTFTIPSVENVAASALTKTYSIVKDSEFVSYAIADIAPIKVEDDGTGHKVSDNYKETAFKVTAKTKDGATVSLKPNVDYSVQGITIADTTGYVTAPGTLTFADKENTTTKTVKVTINNTGEELTKELTFSTAAPKSVKVVSRDADKKDKPAINVAGGVAEIDNTALYALTDIVSTDQYNVEKVDAATNAKITFSLVSGTATFTDNGLETAKVTNASKDAVVNAKFTVDGQSTTVKVTFDGAIDTIKPKGAGVVIEGTYGTEESTTKLLQPGSKITFKFSEKLAAGDNNANRDAIVLAIQTGLTADNIDITYNADLTEFYATVKAEKTIDLSTDKTVTVTAAKVVDLAGNEATANVVFTVPAK